MAIGSMRLLPGLLLVSSLQVSLADAEPARRIATFEEIGRAINACWQPPSGSAGAEVTVRFGLTGKGELRGPPMVTYSRVFGSPAMRKRVVESALRAVEECTPIRLTEALGPIVANRVLTIRFVQKSKSERSA